MTARDLEPRVATLATIRDPQSGVAIDRGLVLWFPAPRSFTGEDAAEFQIHGSRAVIRAMFRVLASMDGVRPAGPGEFVRRALECGKFDLIDVEALADLIDAETEEQRKLASVHASGILRRFIEKLRAELIELMAVVETDLDFADEEDRPVNISDSVARGLSSISAQLSKINANYCCIERVREGLTVLIAGPPNAGKSSLLNALAQRDAAIVSEYAGTTRDLLEVRLDLDGFPVNIIDTAGIRPSNDPIEMEGIRRAIAKSSSADLVLWLSSVEATLVDLPKAFKGRPHWNIITKADLRGSSQAARLALQSGLEVSVVSGQNLNVLVDQLKTFAKEHMTFEGVAYVTTERQMLAVSGALRAIDAAKRDGLALEIVSEELRAACFSLENLIGKVGVEDVLDRLFSRFCIGK